MSQSALAEAAGFSPPQINRWENNERPASLEHLRTLATVLKCSLVDLLPEGDATRNLGPNGDESVFQITSVQKKITVQDPKEMVVDSPYMEPILKLGSTILYDASVRTIDEPGIYVFQRETMYLALHAEPVLFSDTPQVRIWGEQGFKELVVDANRVHKTPPFLVGRVRLYAQPL